MRRAQAHHLAAAALASAAVLALAACGSSSSGSSAGSGSGGAYGSSNQGSASTTAAAAPTSAPTLSADPTGALKFSTTTLAAKAGTVTITMNNPSGSGVSHGIAVEGNGVDKDGATVQPGGASVLKVTLKPGTYSFYCPVPGHEGAGMKGTLTVT